MQLALDSLDATGVELGSVLYSLAVPADGCYTEQQLHKQLLLVDAADMAADMAQIKSNCRMLPSRLCLVVPHGPQRLRHV